jgi:hypothetical protein
MCRALWPNTTHKGKRTRHHDHCPSIVSFSTEWAKQAPTWAFAMDLYNAERFWLTVSPYQIRLSAFCNRSSFRSVNGQTECFCDRSARIVFAAKWIASEMEVRRDQAEIVQIGAMVHGSRTALRFW